MPDNSPAAPDTPGATNAAQSVAEVLESISDAFFALDRDWRFTYLNAAAERALMRPRAALLGRRLWDEFPASLGTAFEREYRRAMRDGVTVQFEEFYPPLQAMFDVRAYPTPAGLSVYFQDVSERHRALDVAERQLAESEARFRQLANTIPQLAWMARPDGHIFWYNRRWYDYTGTTPEQMEGWGWQAVHDPDELSRVIGRWKAALAAGEPWEDTFPLRRHDGQFRWHLSRAEPLRDEAGRITLWFGTNTDITEQRLVQQRLEEESHVVETINRVGRALAGELDLRRLVQTITDATTELSRAEFGSFFYNVLDEKGESYALYTLSGVPREAFASFPMPRNTDVFGPTFRGEGVVRLDDVTKDPRYGKNAPYHGMPPGHLPVRSYLAVPVISRSGEVLGGLFYGHSQAGVFGEREERLVVGIASQAAVAIDNARLYDAARRANDAKDKLLASERAARAEAERASRTKDEFLATLSHELRTPLNAILGWAQMLRVGDANGGCDDLREGLEIIERNARVQTQLIEDLLDMSRITAGKLRLDVQRVDPAAVIEAALETVRPAAEAKEIRLQRLIDPHAGPIAGDPARLQQAVWNLLSNAIKFTPKGGRVRVVLERVNSHVEISVSDTGQGIKPEFLPYLFERFRQADASTTRRHGGLGLGLSIVKSLVEMHGGSVRATSPGEGMGATFTLLLPLSVVRSEGAEGDAARVHPRAFSPGPLDCEFAPLDGVRVLVVDDEPDARNLVRRVLAECRAEVRVAGSGAEALGALAEFRPHVLVSDIGMPEMDGYDLLRRVRRLPSDQGGATPAVALTAFARSEDRTRALLAGYLAHVAKPVEPAELVATVAAVAGRTGGPTPE